MEQIKKIREKTGAGVMAIKKALDEANGDVIRAEEILKKSSQDIVAKRIGRDTSQGLIDSYVHLGKVGVLIEVNCETDFVAMNDDFKTFVHEIALQVASSDAKNVKELLLTESFKNPGTKTEELVNSIIAKTGENIQIKRFVKYTLGE